MSTHPNVVLMSVLTPDELSRKTMRSILEVNDAQDKDGLEQEIVIGTQKYHHIVMESDYQEDYQISAQEGDLIFFDLVTYGYGENIEWTVLETQKNALELWSSEMCEQFNCTHKIFVTANYW